MEKLIGGTILLIVGCVIGAVLAGIFMVHMIQIGTNPNPDAMSGYIVK